VALLLLMRPGRRHNLIPRATSVAIHSSPYHFSGDQLRFDWVEPEPGLPGFYTPATDTLLVLDLHQEFDVLEFENWFKEWQDDGLLFLASVDRFRWCDLTGYIGELTAQELHRRFLEGDGLVFMGNGVWRRPDQLLRGMDIFHDPQRFVPGGASMANLWTVLGVSEPGLADCLTACRALADKPYDTHAEAVLMDVFRFIEHLTASAERKDRERLRNLPLACSGEWVRTRPVYFVDDTELRESLAKAQPGMKFWNPPCDIRDFKSVVAMLGVERLSPQLNVLAERDEAFERGEAHRLRFGHAVDHLSTELARSDPATRDKLSMAWDRLEQVPLFIYKESIPAEAIASALSPYGALVKLRALVQNPLEFHLVEDVIGDRDFGGRLIASLFPQEVRRRIDGEWALAWQKSRDTAAEVIRLASDAKRTEAMTDAAAAINAAPKGKITVAPPASRIASSKPRTLKESVGAVLGATVQRGTPSTEQARPKDGGSGLKSRPPAPSGSPRTNGPQVPPTAYTTADLEQRGWELLVQGLETSPDHKLVDFRKRHGVGADGVINWKHFVEMKATARGPQAQVELSNNEFERAKERKNDFILALVSGLESGQKDEVRLIFDPANCATVRPTNGVIFEQLIGSPGSDYPLRARPTLTANSLDPRSRDTAPSTKPPRHRPVVFRFQSQSRARSKFAG
jgi:uncharacterized protein DUF3883